jgi:hypothetical protein
MAARTGPRRPGRHSRRSPAIPSTRVYRGIAGVPDIDDPTLDKLAEQAEHLVFC